MLESLRQASVPRDVFPPTPPGPEGSNGNGLLRVQWVTGAWLCRLPVVILGERFLRSVELALSEPRGSTRGESNGTWASRAMRRVLSDAKNARFGSLPNCAANTALDTPRAGTAQ